MNAQVTMALETNTLVVLLMPELLGPAPDWAALAASFAAAPKPVRALVALRRVCPLALLDCLDAHHIPRQFLTLPDVAAPSAADRAAGMPPGSTIAQFFDLALAWSDVIIATPGLVPDEPTKALLDQAAELHKHVCPPGCTRMRLVVRPSVADRLDPENPGWLRFFVGRSGRFEQLWLELFAWGWPCEVEDRERERRRWKERLKKQLMLGAYFAPDDWENAAPDPSARDKSAPIVAAFERLDRSALFGACMHRDMLWVVYIFGAVAVLFAVLGALSEPLSLVRLVTGIVELAALVVVGAPIWAARRKQLQERWTAARLAAEQLRIARLCLPLMILPPALSKSEQSPDEHGRSAQFTFDALSEVSRAVRDQGVPNGAVGIKLPHAIAWLRLIVRDQIKYHRNNHRKLEHAENRLTTVTQYVYFASVAAVCVELLMKEWHWLLVITAAGPAFAAALHGVAGRLNMVHRVELSRDAERELLRIDRKIEALASEVATDPARGWTRLRTLAYQAADIMGQETRNWHGLLRRAKEVVP